MSSRSTCTRTWTRKPTQASPNEIRFDEAALALLAENHTHYDLKQRLHQLVMKEAEKLPPVKVLYCTSYGRFQVSAGFRALLRSRSINSANRSDPALIKAISDYGRLICDRFPFILDEMRVAYTWKLNELLAKMMEELTMSRSEMEFDPDLITEATSFMTIYQMCDSTTGYWRSGCLGTHPNGHSVVKGQEIDLMTFAEMHPDFWMTHHSFGPGPGSFKISFRFAHFLLQGSNRARYQVGPDEVQDAAIYEFIGLKGACTSLSHLDIEEIPALVDYSINEYDGKEEVEYWCKAPDF